MPLAAGSALRRGRRKRLALLAPHPLKLRQTEHKQGLAPYRVVSRILPSLRITSRLASAEILLVPKRFQGIDSRRSACWNIASQ
jgi:hypothetical protein